MRMAKQLYDVCSVLFSVCVPVCVVHKSLYVFDLNALLKNISSLRRTS